MEFGEKLQMLRKNRGLTQEELAEALFVSRTAVSKWESGRGYPSIDSLKQISAYFSVTIDDLLSGERLLSIAENENRASLRRLCGMLSGVTDVFSFLLFALPLYPSTVSGYVYAVNLFAYTQTTAFNRAVYWVLFIGLMLMGVLRIVFAYFKSEKLQSVVAVCSLGSGVLAVLFPALAGETYAVALAFLLLMIKVLLLFHTVKAKA